MLGALVSSYKTSILVLLVLGVTSIKSLKKAPNDLVDDCSKSSVYVKLKNLSLFLLPQLTYLM